MTLTPKVTTEDVRLILNGAYSSGSGNYTFWGQEISSGSVLAQLNLANYYLYEVLGRATMDSVDEITSMAVRSAELNYSCFRLLVNFSGGVITDGFNWAVGPIRVDNPNMLNTYKNLMSGFQDAALAFIKMLQPMHILKDQEQPYVGRTPHSVM